LAKTSNEKYGVSNSIFDTKFYCLVIGEQANPEQLKVFDQSWLYNPEEKGVYREIEEGFLDIQSSSYL
jgi:hypothetical protein